MDEIIKLEIHRSDLHKLLLNAISDYKPFPEVYTAMLPANRCIKDIKKYIKDNK